MKASKRVSIPMGIVLISLAFACSAPEPEGSDGGVTLEAPSLPAELFNYANPELPEHFFVETEGFHAQVPLVDSDNTPADNPVTDAGATLGRVIFYDVNFSANRTVACASQKKVFPTTGF